jgi:hypothetical protein
VAFPPECRTPPPCCFVTIDPHDEYVELIVGDVLLHRYCMGCAHVVWEFCPCR